MRERISWVLLLGLGVLTLTSGATRAGPDDPQVERSATSDRLEALPRLPIGQRKVVAIYQFVSGVPAVSNSALTDMFTTALIKSGAFLVAERERLATDLTTEKNLNARGQSTGDTAQHRIAAAQFIFEGAVSEADMDENDNSSSFSLGGMSSDHASTQGKLAIDVRIVDADSGLVLDSVDVSKVIRTRSSGVSGVGSLVDSLAGLAGAPVPLSPDASEQHSQNDGVDEALRACIEAAVLELVHRYGAPS